MPLINIRPLTNDIVSPGKTATQSAEIFAGGIESNTTAIPSFGRTASVCIKISYEIHLGLNGKNTRTADHVQFLFCDNRSGPNTQLQSCRCKHADDRVTPADWNRNSKPTNAGRT